MTGDDLKRVSAVAGIGGFVLALLLLLAFAEPGHALLAALAAGLALGTGVFVAGSLALLSRPVVARAPRVSALVDSPAEPEAPPVPEGFSLAAALSAAANAGGPPQPHGPSDTATLTVDDVVKAQDLHQTVRLDPADLQYAMPELTPEEILKEREGIDEAFLKAGIGLEEKPGASENVDKDKPQTGGTT